LSYTRVDVAIVGAGIAGLAAARRAEELGLSYVVLEAKDRIGGRIHTATRADGRSWDTGAHWLRQPPINKLIAEADRLEVAYDRQWRPLSSAWQDGEWLSEFEADEVLHQIDAAEDLAGDLIETGEDASFHELLDPAYAHLPLAEAVLALTHAASPRQASAVDHKRYGPFDGDWAVSAGFGTLVSRLFGDVDVQFGAPVRVIDWGSSPIRVDFGHSLIEADRVLATVSTGAMAGGNIHFAPDLPDETRAAIESLPMGAQAKVSYVIDPASVDLEEGSVLHTAGDDLPVTFYRPAESDLVIAVLSGPGAADLERTGADALIEAAFDRYGAVFGSAALATVHDTEVAAWLTDPYTAGAASTAVPGAAGSRDTLRAGVERRLCFAGEATSSASFGTAHGAYASGVNAMEDIAESLGHKVERIWEVNVFRAPRD
jgi:monoamine oxidase